MVDGRICYVDEVDEVIREVNINELLYSIMVSVDAILAQLKSESGRKNKNGTN